MDSNLPGLHQPFDHHGFAYTMVKAFGPTILEARLPDTIFERMLSLTDDLLADSSRRSYGANLVGQIREEPEISMRHLREYGVHDYLSGLFSEFMLGCSYCNADRDYKDSVADFQKSETYVNPVRIKIEAAWLVSQKSGEYNPIHNHSSATLSSVMYLKVPPEIEDNPIPGKAAIDGHIEWVDQSANSMQNATLRVKPVAGMFYIFPASLLHLVYPFKGTEERRSVSINASHLD